MHNYWTILVQLKMTRCIQDDGVSKQQKENEGKGSMKFYRVPLKRFESMSESIGENPFAAFHSLDEEDDFGHQIGKKGGSMLNGKRNKRKSGLE